jgi:superfamily II RNA helicase
MVKLCDTPYPEHSQWDAHFGNYPYPLSDFQKYAIEGIVEGHHVLVTAHTGSGKTLPAEFAIEHFVKQGKKVIYTSPIKALSNQKFSEFSRKYPHISFGLLTGDIKTNPEADVLIMTTEILMNTLFLQTHGDQSENVELQFNIDIENELACVVFDEVHYINDADRGQTWEKTILMLPPQIQMVMLSATIDNPQRFAKWAQRGSIEKEVYLASTEKRVVPLSHYGYLTINEGSIKLVKDKELEKEIRGAVHNLIPLQDDRGKFNENGYKTLAKMSKVFQDRSIFPKRKHVLNNLVMFLRDREMLPAIGFVFSRKLVEACAADITVPLLEDDSKVGYTVRKECEQIVRKLPNFREYLELPEYIQLVSLLEKGVGIHHSGMVPVLREIVEIMISKKYIKLLFATESFAIGLDCPIKTAVFTGIMKFDGSSERILMSHEYTQMAGRAGRRGIDKIGHVVHCNNLFKVPSMEDYKTMLGGKPQQLVSKFRISYGLVLNLLKNGKTKMADFVKFTENSMVHEEIQTSISGQNVVIDKKRLEIEEATKSLHQLNTPYEICLEFAKLEADMQYASNKKRKQIDREIKSILTQNPKIKLDMDVVNAAEKMKIDLLYEQDNIDYLHHYIEENVEKVCDVLITRGFVEKYPNEEHHEYNLTDKGRAAAGMAEIHSLVAAQMLYNENWFQELSVEQLIGYLACFTDVNVAKDQQHHSPHTKDRILFQCITNLESTFQEYDQMELERKMYTGHDYQEPICYDMPDLASGWCYCEDEIDCKRFIQNDVAILGISVGDFTKALLKISTIARELSIVAELACETAFQHKLSQVDSKILKYVTTAQSLYV